MKKKFNIFFSLIMASVFICLNSSFTFATTIQGDGTENSPYIIENEEQLIDIGTGDLPASAYYKLNNDISLITRSWTPIGVNFENGFSGNFDGNNHTISNLVIGSSTNSYSEIGLFSNNSGTISNVNLEVNSIIGNDYTGGIAGSNSGILNNCKVSGNISADNSYKNNTALGGVVGKNTGTVKNCSSNVTLKDGNYNTGGVVGYSENSVSNCEFKGTANDLDTSYFGGIVGYSKGDITSCSNQGTINTYLKYLGGVAGYAESGKISLSSNLSSITSTTTYDSYIGGFVGYNDNAEIENCFSIGDVTCLNTSNYNTYVGGFFGWNKSSQYAKNSYCVGKVLGKTASAFANGTSTLYTNCFYNKTVQNTVEIGAFGLSDDEMKDVSEYSKNFTFWDFNSVWGIDESINKGYPYLLSMVKHVTGISLSDSEITLGLGESINLDTFIQPIDATNKNVIWSSSNKNVAEVDKNGRITANGVGSSNIVATTADGEFSASCKVNVVVSQNLNETLIFKIDDVYSVRGQKITVPVRLLAGNSAGVASIGFDIKYDTTYLTIDENSIRKGSLFTSVSSDIDAENGVVSISAVSDKNIVGNGVVCYVDFIVAPNIEGNKSTPINFNMKKLTSIVGSSTKNLKSSVYGGSVNVKDFLYGDLDGDGRVTAKDAALALEKALNSTFILPIEK